MYLSIFYNNFKIQAIIVPKMSVICQKLRKCDLNQELKLKISPPTILFLTKFLKFQQRFRIHFYIFEEIFKISFTLIKKEV